MSVFRDEQIEECVSFKSPVHLSPRSSLSSYSIAQVSDLEGGVEEDVPNGDIYGTFSAPEYKEEDFDFFSSESEVLGAVTATAQKSASSRKSPRSFWPYLILLTLAAIYAVFEIYLLQQRSGTEIWDPTSSSCGFLGSGDSAHGATLQMTGVDKYQPKTELINADTSAGNYTHKKVKIFRDEPGKEMKGQRNAGNHDLSARCATFGMIGGCTLFGFAFGYFALPFCCGVKMGGKKNAGNKRKNNPGK